MASQSERGRIDQIVSEFFAKSLHVILESRVLSLSPKPSQGDGILASSSHRTPNRWFNLELDQSEVVQEHVEPWRRSTWEPMVVDIILQQPVAGSSGWSEGLSSPSTGSPSEGDAVGRTETLLERWVVQSERRSSGSSNSLGKLSGDIAGGLSNTAVEVPVVYKRTVILLRSLYAMARVLPAHRLFRLAKADNEQQHAFSLSYRVTPSPSPLSDSDAAAMSTWHLTPVDTPTGRMTLSVAYRHTTAVTALEVDPPLLPRIIADYVGSPTTDPLRRFPAQQTGPPRRGWHVVPLTSPKSAPPPNRRHSWSISPVHSRHYPPPSSPSSRAQQQQRASLTTRTQSMPPSSSHPIHIQPTGPHPLLHTPSPSPSPPTAAPLPDGKSSGNVPRSVSAPVSIPRPDQQGPAAPQAGSPAQVRPQQQPPKVGAPRYARSRSLSSNDSSTPPMPAKQRPPSWSSSSPPKWQPSSAPTYPDPWDRHMRPPTPTTPSVSGSDLSGVAFSPPLPFACTPRVSPAVSLGGTSSSGGSGGVPPISGRDTSALVLARYPSFTLSVDPKAAARMSISPLAESSLRMSPPHPYHHLKKVLAEDQHSGPPSGLKRSLYGPPRITLPSGQAAGAAPPEDDLDDEGDLPFVVDDVEDDLSRDRYHSSKQGV